MPSCQSLTDVSVVIGTRLQQTGCNDLATLSGGLNVASAHVEIVSTLSDFRLGNRAEEAQGKRRLLYFTTPFIRVRE